MGTFSITNESNGDATAIVSVRGYLDFDCAPALKQSLIDVIDAGSSQLVVDLTEVGFIDSTAIGVLIGGQKRLQESGGSLAVVCTNENVRDIFDLVGLNEVVSLHGSRDDAIAAFARAA